MEFIEINIKKKHILLMYIVLLSIISMLYVVGYGSNDECNPIVHGHPGNEIHNMPPPDFEVNISPAIYPSRSLVYHYLNTSVDGINNTLYVKMYCRDLNGTYGTNNLFYGGTEGPASSFEGAAWVNLTNISIEIIRGDLDYSCQNVELKLWKIDVRGVSA